MRTACRFTFWILSIGPSALRMPVGVGPSRGWASRWQRRWRISLAAGRRNCSLLSALHRSLLLRSGPTGGGCIRREDGLATGILFAGLRQWKIYAQPVGSKPPCIVARWPFRGAHLCCGTLHPMPCRLALFPPCERRQTGRYGSIFGFEGGCGMPELIEQCTLCPPHVRCPARCGIWQRLLPHGSEAGRSQGSPPRLGRALHQWQQRIGDRILYRLFPAMRFLPE